MVKSSVLVTATLSAPDAGNIIIDTGRLLLRDEASISTESTLTKLISGEVQLAVGKAGDLTVNAPEAVELSNKSQLTTQTLSFGDAGKLTITTGQLQVFSSSQISSVASSGNPGRAGDLIISTHALSVSDRSQIKASTSDQGRGGNILINAKDLLLLRRGGEISTWREPNSGGGGDGGNININTAVLVPVENSSINANAFQGRGGNIQITAQGIFRSPDSAIAASSLLGFNGTVRINTPLVNSSQGVVELPSQIVAPAALIANSCIVRRNAQQGSFIITGAGGLPTLPDDER